MKTIRDAVDTYGTFAIVLGPFVGPPILSKKC